MQVIMSHRQAINQTVNATEIREATAPPRRNVVRTRQISRCPSDEKRPPTPTPTKFQTHLDEIPAPNPTKFQTPPDEISDASRRNSRPQSDEISDASRRNFGPQSDEIPDVLPTKFPTGSDEIRNEKKYHPNEFLRRNFLPLPTIFS